ncbi:24579_t:CDS:2 [Cetraspora pellucida]|uniref:24579_t:CDS:1 n=1 Tax=Cetraspora pellucida TaxID=1433469 RepID=A0A9N8WQQ7_9GLOM|nr:24579_t:CDS:2 [Cetraspora pellucida]
MEDAQSTIDSLRELNTKFILQIDELRKENGDIKVENIKLKQDKAKIEVRFVKLEQNDKDTVTENAELKARVAQRVILNNYQSLVNITFTEMINSSHSNESNNALVSDISVNALVQICRLMSNSDDTLEQIENSKLSTASLPQDIINNNLAKTLDFVEMKCKEYVNKEIIERIRKKKLQKQNLSSNNNSPEPSNLSYKDQNLKSSDLLEQLPIKQKNKTLKIYIKPLIQELNIKTLKKDTIKIVNVDASEKQSSIFSYCVTAFDKNSTDNQLSTIKLYIYSKEFDEIASWYSYKKFFEKRHSEILSEILKNKLQLTKQKAYKLASSQIYDEMLCYLSTKVSISNTPDSSILRKLDINITSSTKVSALPEKVSLKIQQFPYLTLKYSNEYGDYFNCPKTCLICNKEHKRDDVKGEWRSGDYVNTKTYCLTC